MTEHHDGWATAQRRRFTRENAHLWIRPDAKNFMQPAAYERWQQEREAKAVEYAPDAALEAEHKTLLQLKAEVAALKAEIKFRKLLAALKAYNPNQPRVPSGTPDGGQWTSGHDSDGRVHYAQFGGTLTDADGRPYYRPGGHHEMPEAVYKRWNLEPGTARIFKQSSTGEVGATMRTTPDGPRIGNIWEGHGGLHRVYNDAIAELGNRYIRENNLKPDGSNMTPKHAQEILKRIRESDDPRIRDFNLNMRRIQRLRRLRGGADD